MTQKILFMFLIFLSLKMYSQKMMMGKIRNDSSVGLGNVTVMNMRTEQSAVSEPDGNFIIAAESGDQLRFTRTGYERFEVKIHPENFTKPLNITLQTAATPIEEVEVGFKPTGNLAKDLSRIPGAKAANLNAGVGKYIAQKSDLSVTQHRPGEFIQPVGKGFVIIKKGYKWEIFDLVKFLENALGNDYFATFGLLPPQQDSFVLFVLKDFPKDDILRYGYISDQELGQFKNLAETKIRIFK